MPGLFIDLAFGRRPRRLAIVELALGQHPFIALAQAHDRDQRRRRPPHHNASSRKYRRSRHRYIFQVPTRYPNLVIVV
jgi:hypothetical protein